MIFLKKINIKYIHIPNSKIKNLGFLFWEIWNTFQFFINKWKIRFIWNKNNSKPVYKQLYSFFVFIFQVTTHIHTILPLTQHGQLIKFWLLNMKMEHGPNLTMIVAVEIFGWWHIQFHFLDLQMENIFSSNFFFAIL